MEEASSSRLTRRRMLGRTAVGAAAVWAAPTITSVGLAPAAATSANGDCPTPRIGAFQGVTTFSYAGQLTAPADLTENDASPWSNNATGFVFNESGPIQIPAGGYASETADIPAGTWVCTVYVHSSPTSGVPRYRMTINFPGSTILGYDGRTGNLQNSDPLFAVPGVDYAARGRGHEWGGGAGGNGDYYAQINANTAEIRMAVSDCCTDHGRFFVACL